MRLIKLAMMALFGYALYEFVRGVLQDTQGRGSEASSGSGDRGSGRAFTADSEVGRYNMTGGGEGLEEATVESDGGSVRHHVGRGVIR